MNLCSQYRPTDSNDVKLGSGMIRGSIVSLVSFKKKKVKRKCCDI